MANDDESVGRNYAASVDGDVTGGGVAPAKAPRQWCNNTMYGNFNPGTSHERDIFTKKKKGLVDDKKFEVSTKNAGSIFTYLIGK